MLRWLKCQKLLEVILKYFRDSRLHNWFASICRSFLTLVCKELYCWKGLSFTGVIFHLKKRVLAAVCSLWCIDQFPILVWWLAPVECHNNGICVRWAGWGLVVREGAGGIYNVLLGVFLLFFFYFLTNLVLYLVLLAYKPLGVRFILSADLSSCWIEPMWVWGPAGTGNRGVLQSEKCFALTILDGSSSSEYQRATWTSVLTVWLKEWDVLVLIEALFSWSEAAGTQWAGESRKSSCPGVYKLKQAILVVGVWFFSL